ARPVRRRQVVSQFGSLTLDVKHPDLLLVPTAVSLTATPDPLAPPLLDNFQCYTVRPSRGAPGFTPIRGGQVTDGLETVTVDLLKPARLCVPADLDGEDPSAPGRPAHLLCYRTQSNAAFGEVDFFTRNRFGTDDGTLIHRRELCVPSVESVPTTTTTSVPPTTVTVPPTTSTTSSTTTSTTVPSSTTTTRASTTTTTAVTTTTPT